MKVKAKRGLIYQGMVYKAGEVFEVTDTLGYAFTWLTKNRWIELLDAPATADIKPEVKDDLLIPTVELPPLEDPPIVKKGKKNA